MNTVPVIAFRNEFLEYLNDKHVKLENFKNAIHEFRKERGLLSDGAWHEYQKKQILFFEQD